MFWWLPKSHLPPIIESCIEDVVSCMKMELKWPWLWPDNCEYEDFWNEASIMPGNWTSGSATPKKGTSLRYGLKLSLTDFHNAWRWVKTCESQVSATLNGTLWMQVTLDDDGSMAHINVIGFKFSNYMYVFIFRLSNIYLELLVFNRVTMHSRILYAI